MIYASFWMGIIPYLCVASMEVDYLFLIFSYFYLLVYNINIVWFILSSFVFIKQFLYIPHTNEIINKNKKISTLISSLAASSYRAAITFLYFYFSLRICHSYLSATVQLAISGSCISLWFVLIFFYCLHYLCYKLF